MIFLQKTMPRVQLSSVNKRFSAGGGVTDISLDIAAGQHLVIVGPSGAGKTTLLRLIAGLESVDRGSISIGSKDITNSAPHERRIGFIGQRPGLYPHLNVRRNLGFAVELRGDRSVSKEELSRRIVETATWLGLSDLLDRSLVGLSGGELQRIAIGRMVVAGHGLWLLDEPLAHLDPLTRDSIRWQLGLLRERRSPTIIEVTHDPMDARILGDRVAVLIEGRVVQVGSPAEVYARPNSRNVATSLGWPPMNFIDGSAAPVAGAPGPMSFPGILGVRPEDVTVGEATDGAVDLGQWKLVRVETPGPQSLWTLIRDDQLIRRWASENDVSASVVSLHVKRERQHWFDRTTGQRLNE